MSETTAPSDAAPASRGTSGVSVRYADLGLRRRYRAEQRLKLIGLSTVSLALALLAYLIFDVAQRAWPAFLQTQIELQIDFDESVIDPQGTRERDTLRTANYQALINAALYREFPLAQSRTEQRAVRGLVSRAASYELRDMVVADPRLIGTTQTLWLNVATDIDQFWKGAIPRDVPEADRRVKDATVAQIDQLAADDRLRTVFARNLFTNADSRDAEEAGVWGAIVGSFWLMIVVLVLAVPVGVASATYLEEFAPKNRWTDLIEININNLAAVPSIVFGLLGLAVFLGFVHLPRSAPIIGGLTLTLMTLPTVVVATRAALRAVPPSIRWGALGVGASRVQMVTHHVLPLALPGIMTGTIIGLAQALGETAPLLMIGMVGFFAEAASNPLTDPSGALPVQIFLWYDQPERAFQSKAAAAILILMGFLLTMNALAIYLRNRFDRSW